MGGIYEDADTDDCHCFSGYDLGRGGAWWRLPEELTAWSVLPHGQQYGVGALPLKNVALVALITLISIGHAYAADLIIGRASVVDGDTLEITGERIRLDGIDAPESWQQCQDAEAVDYRCGAVAAKALDEFLAQSRPTECRRVSRDRYGRTVAVCTRADGADIPSWLVRHGHALDWPKYSKGRYAPQQHAARAAKEGMWAGGFVEPWEARSRR